MSEYREADDEADSQQQVAIDLRAVPGEMRATKIALQRRIVKRQARKAAFELG
jgi:hypothetical protein